MDESGNHGLTKVDPCFPIFILCGILISEEQHNILTQRITKLKEKFSPQRNIYLHSRDIRKNENGFEFLFDTFLKTEFYKDLNNIISDVHFTIISSGIDKNKYISQVGNLGADVYALSLSFIIERTVFCLEEDFWYDKKVIIYLEGRGKRENQDIRKYFDKVVSNGTNYVSQEKINHLGMRLEIRTKESQIAGLELADLCAYPIARHIIEPTLPNPAFDILMPKIYSRNGKLYGIKVYPK
jgi:hypothetical protein